MDQSTHTTWRPAPGYGGHYEVSDDGQVRSFKLGRTRLLRQSSIPAGHRQVCLQKPDGGQATVKVHQLVLLAFVGPKPERGEVRHLNGNPADNRLENLRWGTHSENKIDRVRLGEDHEARKTECIRGHQFDSANTYLRPTGGRQCRACVRLSKARRRQSLSAARR